MKKLRINDDFNQQPILLNFEKTKKVNFFVFGRIFFLRKIKGILEKDKRYKKITKKKRKKDDKMKVYEKSEEQN